MPRRWPSGRSGRVSLKDQVALNAKILRALIPADRPMPAPVASLAHLDKAKRVVVNRSDESELESAVLREVGDFLAMHPKVLLCIRQNGGAALMRGKDGRDMPVSFYKIVRRSVNFTLTDFWGFVQTPRGIVPAAWEAKRRNWKYTGTDREREQAAFIAEIIRFGGVGGFVTSAEQAKAIIEG